MSHPRRILLSGIYFLRAHARLAHDGGMHHWWSDEQTFTVA